MLRHPSDCLTYLTPGESQVMEVEACRDPTISLTPIYTTEDPDTQLINTTPSLFQIMSQEIEKEVISFLKNKCLRFNNNSHRSHTLTSNNILSHFNNNILHDNILPNSTSSQITMHNINRLATHIK